MQVPDYKIPVLDTTVQRFGQKPPNYKKPLRPQTAKKLHVKEKDHKIYQKHQIRQVEEGLGYFEKIKIQNRIENEMERKRFLKELEQEREIEKEAEQQVLHLKQQKKTKKEKEIEENKKKNNKNVSEKLFYNKVQYHYVENAKIQKIRELKALAATKKFDKEYNQEQLQKTQKFMEQLHQKERERKQKIKELQEKQNQLKQQQFSQTQGEFYNRKNQNQLSKKEEERRKLEQEKVHKQLKMVMSLPKYEKTENTPAPGYHMPEFVKKLDKQTQEDIRKLREKKNQKEQKKIQFGGQKHKLLINQKINIIKNKNSDGLKVALVSPQLNFQKNFKFQFKVNSGFSENIYLGICQTEKFLQNFQDKEKMFEFQNFQQFQKLKFKGAYMIGNGQKFQNGKSKGEEIPFKIEKTNILEISFDVDTSIITFTKINNKKQCQIQLEQDQNQQYNLFCMLGKINDEIEIIPNQLINKKQKQENQQQKKEESQNDKEKDKEKQENNQEKDKNNQEKDKNNKEKNQEKEKNEKENQVNDQNKNDQKDDKSKKKEEQEQKEKEQVLKMQKQREKRMKEQEKKKQEQQEKATILQGIENVSGYFPEAKNKKELTYSFSKSQRQDLFPSEAKLIPGPGKYDPVDPKQIRAKTYGNFKKGPLPFLSSCQNVKIGKESRESGGATFMNGAETGIFYNDDDIQDDNNLQQQLENNIEQQTVIQEEAKSITKTIQQKQ